VSLALFHHADLLEGIGIVSVDKEVCSCFLRTIHSWEVPCNALVEEVFSASVFGAVEVLLFAASLLLWLLVCADFLVVVYQASVFEASYLLEQAVLQVAGVFQVVVRE
jgi:hypothetical protein